MLSLRALLVALGLSVAVLSVPSWAEEDFGLDGLDEDDFEDEDEPPLDPLLMVHRAVAFESNSPVVQVNKSFTVTYQLFNIGSEDAHEVVLNDNNWNPAAFDLVKGSLTRKWDEIKAGSLETHEVELVAKHIGVFQGDPARVELFAATGNGESEEDEVKREAHSSSFGVVHVLSAGEYARATDKTDRNWAVFAVLAILTIAVPYSLYTSASNKINKAE